MTGGAIMIAEQKEKNVYLELADKPLLTLKEFCIYLGNKPFEQNLLRTFIENRIKWSFFATKISLLKKL